MILILCSSLLCRTVVRVMAADPVQTDMLVGPGSQYWPNKFTCPRCDGPAVGHKEGEIDPNNFRNFTLIELEAEEMFRALNGLGLPEEQNCHVEVLLEVFGKQKVKNVAGYNIPGSNRFCIEWLEMEDGTKLYFGASAHGATIYRIVNKTSAVKKVLEETDVG